MTTQNDCNISIFSACISDTFFDTSVREKCRLYLQTTLSENWNFCIQDYSTIKFGLRLFGICWCIQLQRIGTIESFDHTEAFLPFRNKIRDVSMAAIIDESLITSLQSCIILPPKETYKEPFGYRSGDHSSIIVTKMDTYVVQGISPASSLILDVKIPELEPSLDY